MTDIAINSRARHGAALPRPASGHRLKITDCP